MKKVLCALGVIIVLSSVSGFVYLRSYLPNYNIKLTVPGLRNKVLITRNQFAVPSIQAENLDDLYFAWGYVNAQDRMFQMEITKRIGQGRISELIGESTLSKDVFLRAVGFYQIAKESIKKLSPRHMRLLQRYADGINYYLDTEKKPLYMTLLGIEKEKWAVSDSMVVGIMFNWFLAYNMNLEFLYHRIAGKIGESRFRELLNLIPSESPTIVKEKPGDSFDHARFIARVKHLGQLMGGRSASNNWAVAPSKTTYSGAILSSDPHVPITKIPSDFYLVHAKAADFEVVGGQVPGLPFVVFGYNPYMAWGLTNHGADVIDLFFETIDRGKKTCILNGKEFPLGTKNVEIGIKGKGAIQKTLYYAGRRPLLNEVFPDLDKDVSIDWVGFDAMEIDGFFQLNYARNYKEFIEAINNIHMTPQNLVYADIEGNVAYRMIGTLPKRKSGTGNLPQQGAEVASNWDGILDPDKYPALINPDRGFIATANNRVITDYPYDMNATYAPRYRYENIVRMLDGKDNIDVAYVKQMQTDTQSLLARKLIPVMKEYLRLGRNQQAKNALHRVATWNGRVEADQPAATIYNAWLVRFMYHTFADELGRDLAAEYVGQRYISLERFLSLLENGSDFFDDVSTPVKETVQDIATRAFDETLQILAECIGSEDIDEWTWGKVHQIRFDHFLGRSKLLRPFVNYGPFPAKGDCETNLRAHFYEITPPFTATLAAGLRLIVRFDPQPKGYMVLITGENEYFFSKHYTDLTDLWMKGEYFCLEEADIKYEMVMKPRSPTSSGPSKNPGRANRRG